MKPCKVENIRLVVSTATVGRLHVSLLVMDGYLYNLVDSDPQNPGSSLRTGSAARSPGPIRGDAVITMLTARQRACADRSPDRSTRQVQVCGSLGCLGLPPATSYSLTDCPPPPLALRFTRRGPWFSTQLTLSLTVGITSFLAFCWLRRYERFRVLYAPRTMLKGPHPQSHPHPHTHLAAVVPLLAGTGVKRLTKPPPRCRLCGARGARPRIVLRLRPPDSADFRIRRPATRRTGRGRRAYTSAPVLLCLDLSG